MRERGINNLSTALYPVRRGELRLNYLLNKIALLKGSLIIPAILFFICNIEIVSVIFFIGKIFPDRIITFVNNTDFLPFFINAKSFNLFLFDSLKEASNHYGISSSSICENIKHNKLIGIKKLGRSISFIYFRKDLVNLE